MLLQQIVVYVCFECHGCEYSAKLAENFASVWLLANEKKNNMCVDC